MTRLFALLLLSPLTACGMKGALELPPGPPPEPLLGTAKATVPASSNAVPKDLSTDYKRPSQ